MAYLPKSEMPSFMSRPENVYISCNTETARNVHTTIQRLVLSHLFIIIGLVVDKVWKSITASSVNHFQLYYVLTRYYHV